MMYIYTSDISIGAKIPEGWTRSEAERAFRVATKQGKSDPVMRSEIKRDPEKWIKLKERPKRLGRKPVEDRSGLFRIRISALVNEEYLTQIKSIHKNQSVAIRRAVKYYVQHNNTVGKEAITAYENPTKSKEIG